MTKTTELIEHDCCKCGTRFVMEATLDTYRRKEGKEFFCPNGHSQMFIDNQESILKKAQEKLAEVTEELEEAKVEIRKLKCALLDKPEGKTILQKLGLS